MKNFEEEYSKLLDWSKMMLFKAQEILPELRAILDPSHPLPDGCPSHASLASEVFRQFQKRLEDVIDCAKAVETSIWDTNRAKSQSSRSHRE